MNLRGAQRWVIATLTSDKLVHNGKSPQVSHAPVHSQPKRPVWNWRVDVAFVAADKVRHFLTLSRLALACRNR